jgi:hypothetical protein
VLENCASGGNRLDWTLFSRSVTTFANDQYTQPDCMRRIMGRMSAFLPSERLNMIYGPCQWREYGDDAWQVLMGSVFGVSESLENWTAGFRDALRRHLTLHRATEAARQGSFYRLTPDTSELRAWEAWQLHDPDAGAGVLIAWRAASPDDHMLLLPRAIDAGRTYTVSDLYGREEQTVQGETLSAGLRVSLPPHGAALRAYRPTQERRSA